MDNDIIKGRILTDKESERMHQLEYFNTEIKIDKAPKKLFSCKSCIHYSNCTDWNYECICNKFILKIQ